MFPEKIGILGAEYRIVVFPYDDPDLQEEDRVGYCCPYTKKIIIYDFVDLTDKTAAKEAQKQILRHEITHAFLFESGLGYNSNQSEAWAINEEMVDWISWKGPQLNEIWKEAGCA